MFAHPFTDFEASRSELRAGASVRSFIVARVRRCIDDGLLHGNESDIALVLITLTQGLAVAENASRLGTSRESIDRRWALAVNCCPRWSESVALTLRAMELEHAIHSRRTHKVFAPEPVAPEVLQELFELARWAPNHNLTNPWRFRVLGPGRSRGSRSLRGALPRLRGQARSRADARCRVGPAHGR